MPDAPGAETRDLGDLQQQLIGESEAPLGVAGMKLVSGSVKNDSYGLPCDLIEWSHKPKWPAIVQGGGNANRGGLHSGVSLDLHEKLERATALVTGNWQTQSKTLVDTSSGESQLIPLVSGIRSTTQEVSAIVAACPLISGNHFPLRVSILSEDLGALIVREGNSTPVRKAASWRAGRQDDLSARSCIAGPEQRSPFFTCQPNWCPETNQIHFSSITWENSETNVR
ncbi:hypothetical protein RRG08_051967 [Elysia crispata]|uniref:Uncharacterized protein n=1 Tax=Elysia crispata TaxID=231223 RepID=A0AAE0ZCD9_9GAST|nr:hypothetical protein RRG08_051967 [Elysia crispata]